MVRSINEQAVNYKCLRNGNGDTEMHLLLNGEAEMYGKGRMFNRMILAPGNSIGEHSHTGNNEIFYILSGTAEYNDNGNIVTLKPGDVTVCNDGEMHGIKNNGSEPLEFIALILYT